MRSIACGLLLAVAAAVACGETDESEASLDPGRKVGGCFDCEGGEYCITIDAAEETNFCAPDECSGECDCLMDDAAKRHAECSSSCQDGSGLVYCKG